MTIIIMDHFRKALFSIRNELTALYFTLSHSITSSTTILTRRPPLFPPMPFTYVLVLVLKDLQCNFSI